MRRRLFYALTLFLAASFARAQSLSLSDYLNQVKTQGSDYQAQAAAVAGFQKQSHQQDLTYSPVLSANYNHLDDTEPINDPQTQPKTEADAAGVSISDILPFGPKITIGYAFTNANYQLNPIYAGAAALFPNPYYQISPVVSLSVPLFKDFGGAQTGAGVKMVQYQYESSAKSAAYQREQSLYNAKVAYWTLAEDQEGILIRQDTLDRTQKIWDWTKKRVARNLADPPDALEAEASVRLAELDLEKAQETARMDRIQFNRYRGAKTDAVPEQLDGLESAAALLKAEIPDAPPQRLDLQAQEATVKQQKATYDQAHQNVYPDLTANASWRGNGFDSSFGGSNSEAFSTSYPTYSIGVSFNLPLDVFTAAQVADGYWKNYQSAMLSLQDKQTQVGQDWQGLKDSLAEVDKRLEMTAQIVDLQKNKADQEKQRLEFGRTTESELLSSENDYNTARLNHLSVIAEKLSLLAEAQWWTSAE
jgi:outer membrane protein TolC